MRPHVGFSAVVGLDDAKLALLLATVDPRIGGVLLAGDKGSAKTTLARGLARLLPGDAPFVELPLGATEDRVVGSLDLTRLLNGGEAELRPGLLAAAHGGVLYVDEINLLADHLVDVLLDVAVSGVNRVERDGLSVSHPARFVLIGSMNPEEGDLRPQLLDRFGLSVTVRAPATVTDRVAAVRAQLALEAAPASDLVAGPGGMPPDMPGGRSGGAAPVRRDSDDAVAAAQLDAAAADAAAIAAPVDGAVAAARVPADGSAGADVVADAALAERLSRLGPLPALPDAVVEAASELALAVDAQGLRADLTLCRAARAHARWYGRSTVTVDDLRAVAPLALGHRRRRDPFDPRHGDDDLTDAIDETLGPPPHQSSDPAPDPGDAGQAAPDPAASPPSSEERGATSSPPPPAGGASDEPSPAFQAGDADAPRPSGDRPVNAAAELAAATASTTSRRRNGADTAGRRDRTEARDGRFVRDRPATVDTTRVAPAPSAMRVAQRRATEPGAAVRLDDLREPVTEQRTGAIVVIAVDTSGSMGVGDRIGVATGAVLGLLRDAYVRRDRVALVTFRGERAEVALRPTSSVEIARSRLDRLTSGGPTPLAEGIETAHALARREAERSGAEPLLVLITDGRATGRPDARAAAEAAAAELRRRRTRTVVIDAEAAMPRLGLAERVAELAGATLVALDDLDPSSVDSLIRRQLPDRSHPRP